MIDRDFGKWIPPREEIGPVRTNVFKVQLNNVDYYQTPPGELDRHSYNDNGNLRLYTQVPVLRVFGKTENGANVLMHVHGVYPYLYVEYSGSLVPNDGKCAFIPALIRSLTCV
jgi:hypothetical protein